MSDEAHEQQVPQTLEGWYTLHDVYSVDWPSWRCLTSEDRAEVVGEFQRWLGAQQQAGGGDTALYSVVGQKGDLMIVCYRESPEALNVAELSLRRTALFGLLQPAYSYLSVIEVSLYEISAIAMRRVAEQGHKRGTPEFEAALAEELERQKERMKGRLFRDIPPHRYICFYPMSKRRGEQLNWYSLTMDERRAMMRKHGSIGHKYHERVVQVIGGSVGLDDWEWGVSLHSDDALEFKKLVYEMRFDPASALYAEFGPFYVGRRLGDGGLSELLETQADFA